MTEQMNVPRLRFGEFAEKWVLNKAPIKILAGNAYKLEEYTDNGYLLIQGLHIQPCKLVLEASPKYVSTSGTNHLKIDFGDIVLGLNRPVTNNQLKTCRFELDEESVLYQRAGKLKFDTSKLDTEFLYQYIRSPIFMKQLDLELIGSDQPYIRSNLFQATKNIFPLFPEQQKIASFLSKVDEKIGLLSEKKAKLTEYKRGVMQQLFSGKWVNSGKLTFIPPTLRFKADDGSEFPDWKKSTLGDIGKVKMCKRILANQTTEFGDIPFYKIGTFGKQPDAFISTELYSEYRQKYSFPKVGDILMSASGTLGRTVVYDGSPSYYQDSNIVWIENDGSYTSNEFLFYVYQMVKYQSEGGTIQRLYNNIIMSAKFDNPSLAEQKKIVGFLSVIDQKINLASSELDKAKEWKKGLLQQMFV